MTKAEARAMALRILEEAEARRKESAEQESKRSQSFDRD